MGTNLRKPEISFVMRDLAERGWINEREEKKPGKGRLYKIYSFKTGFLEIIAHLEERNNNSE